MAKRELILEGVALCLLMSYILLWPEILASAFGTLLGAFPSAITL